MGCSVHYCDEKNGKCKKDKFDCDDTDVCTLDVCDNGGCVHTILPACILPLVPDTPTPTTTLTPTPAQPGGGGFVGNEAAVGAEPIENEAEVVLVGKASSFTIAGIGAGTVLVFALFGAAVGFNNTKKEPEVPIEALLADNEGNTSAFTSPIFGGQDDAMLNVAHGV